MSMEELLFFNKQPEALPIYEAWKNRLFAACPGALVRVQKTQIAFANKHQFAFVSLPRQKSRGVCIIVTFGINHRLAHPRIEQAVEPYPGRFTHHVYVSSPLDVDDELMDWIKEAYAFAMIK